MSDKMMKAAINLRRAIGTSPNYGVGWLLKGDDEVLQACREFDALLEARQRSEPKESE